jgi:RNA polymerase sigma factor (sigma-70 family)
MHNNGTSEDAKDVFQEAMIIVFQNIRKDKSFTLESSMKTYIYSIARIIWIKHLKKTRTNITHITEDEEYIEFEEPQPFQEYDFKYALYQKVFLQLPKDCQKILRWSNKNWNTSEIATKMSLKSENYVSKRKHFCKEYLIRLIRENPDFYSDKL